MICPYCGNEMNNGYIQSRDGISWKDEINIFPALAWVNGKPILASGIGQMSGAAVIAHKCERCEKIIIDYSKETDANLSIE